MEYQKVNCNGQSLNSKQVLLTRTKMEKSTFRNGMNLLIIKSNNPQRIIQKPMQLLKFLLTRRIGLAHLQHCSYRPSHSYNLFSMFQRKYKGHSISKAIFLETPLPKKRTKYILDKILPQLRASQGRIWSNMSFVFWAMEIQEKLLLRLTNFTLKIFSKVQVF